MGFRRTMLAAALVVVVVLLVSAWLIEWPPFFASRDSIEQPPDLLKATKDDPPAPAVEPVERPGLESTAPEDVLRPPPAPPPDEPDTPVTPVQPSVLPPVEPPPDVPLDIAVSGKTVTKAIDKGLAWLRKKQGRNGSWGHVLDRGAYDSQFHRKAVGTHPAGPTALVLYALLKGRQPLQDPVVRNGFDFLLKHHKAPGTSMETAMVLLAVTATADAPKYSRMTKRPSKPRLRGTYRRWAAQLVDHLVKKRAARGWRYNVTGRVDPLQAGGPEDLVSTHLAALALLSAHELGIKTKQEVWEDILRYTLDQQEDNTLYRPDPRLPRGFAYILGHPVSDEGKATGGTTACGIALVRMALHVLAPQGTWLGIQEREATLQQTATSSIAPADAWLIKHWSPYANPGKKRGAKVLHHHWLWAFETAQDLPREPVAKLGQHVWYAEISHQLVNRQRKDGSWRVGGTWEPADVLDTAFALLFLKRATRKLIRER